MVFHITGFLIKENHTCFMFVILFRIVVFINNQYEKTVGTFFEMAMIFFLLVRDQRSGIEM